MNRHVTRETPPSLTRIDDVVELAPDGLESPCRPAILSIATGTPGPVVRQENAGRFVAGLPRMKAHADGIERLYRNTRIDTRRLAFDVMGEEAVALCERSGTVSERMATYMHHAVPLATEVAGEALRRAADDDDDAGAVDDIGLVIYVSSTGIVAPGVDAALVANLGLARTTARLTISFMGCAAALNGLRVAADHVRAHPDERVLMVCLELSSVNVAYDERMNDVIVHSLFGDGCASVVVGAEGGPSGSKGGGIRIRDHLSHLVEGTEDGIVLGVTGDGITCDLARDLPAYIESGLAEIVDGFLAKHELTRADVELWAVHPGGTRIIDKATSALGLSEAQVAPSWSVLGAFGNMLSPAVLFVMERMARERRAGNTNSDGPATGLAFSFAPGLGVEALLFEMR